MSEIAPKTKIVVVGVRKMRELTLYPLSFADQIKLGDIIAEAANKFLSQQAEARQRLSEASSGAEVDNAAFVKEITDLIQENIQKILKMICDEDKVPSFEELTNDQIVEIASCIFSMNYENSVKNAKSLLLRAKEAFGLKRSQSDSSAGSPSIG